MKIRLLFLLFLLACKDTAGVDPNVVALHNEFAAWKGNALTSYEMTYQRECFCDAALTTPTRVRVVDGQVVAAIDANGKLLSANQLSFFRTIDQTFEDLIDRSDIDGAYFAQLQFDPQLHYPTLVDNNVRNTADAGFVIHISDVVPYQPTPVPTVSRDVSAPVQTDSLLYHLVGVTHGLGTMIHFTMRNDTDAPLSISNCNGEYIIQLEREDNAWKDDWWRGIPACASAPIVIAAHSVRPDSIYLFGAYGTNIMPSFRSRNMQSVFRLRIYDLKLESNRFVLDDPRY